jgi:DNA-binding CsgD family transcriptional regulator
MTPAILEREGELASFEALVAGLEAGEGGLAVLEGPAGIGKSRLLQALRAAADARGLRVLSARGSDLEREFPFGVVRQLLEPVALAPGGERLLTGAAAAARPVFEAPGTEGELPGDANFAVLHGLYWLVLNVAGEAPVLLVLDDLHWCDRASLRFATYLARRLEGQPVLLVAGVRSNEPGTDPGLLAEIVSDPAAAPVRPRPLSEGGVRALVAERLGEPGIGFVAAAHRATGGNPLLLRQLVAMLEADGVAPHDDRADLIADVGPRAVSRTILLRLARLPAPAREVARAVAVLEEAAELRWVAALTGEDEEAVAAATADLARSDILEPDLPLRFVHPLVRDAVLLDLTEAERTLEHGRAARVLSGAGAAPELVAAHLLHLPAEGDPWAVETLRAAARSALAKGAPENAVAALARAAEELGPGQERAQLMLELGRVEQSIASPAAGTHLREAYDTLEDPRLRTDAGRALGRILPFLGPPEAARALVLDVAAGLPEGFTDERQDLAALELAAVFFGAPEPDPDGLLARARALHDEGEGFGARTLGVMSGYMWAVSGGPGAEAAEVVSRAMGPDRRWLTEEPGLFSPVAPLTLALADRDDVEAAWDVMRDHAHRSGSLFGTSAVHLFRGVTLGLAGQLADAEASLREAQGLIRLWGSTSSAETYGAGFLAQVQVWRGRLDAARHSLEVAGEPPFPSEGGRAWYAAQVQLALADARWADALKLLDRFEEWVPFLVHPRHHPKRALRARALDGLGRTDEALALMADELELARRIGVPSTVGHVLRVLGTLEREAGIERLEDAAALLATTPARHEHALALAALGAALRRARRTTEAREPLRLALDLAERCDAEGLLETVRAELHATGARPRTTALFGADALTASERRVALKAAEGRSNRDIAQELFVTPKTVEVHLSAAYRKLGIGSRRELAGVLLEGTAA